MISAAAIVFLRYAIRGGTHRLGGNRRDALCHFLVAPIVATAAVAAAAVIPVVLALSFLRHSACSKQPVGGDFADRGRAVNCLDPCSVGYSHPARV
jgi:hypothetical protein